LSPRAQRDAADGSVASEAESEDCELQPLELVLDSSVTTEGDISLTEDDMCLGTEQTVSFSVMQPTSSVLCEKASAVVVVKKAELRRNPTDAEIKLVAKSASRERLFTQPPQLKQPGSPLPQSPSRIMLSNVLKNAAASLKELNLENLNRDVPRSPLATRSTTVANITVALASSSSGSSATSSPSSPSFAQMSALQNASAPAISSPEASVAPQRAVSPLSPSRSKNGPVAQPTGDATSPHKQLVLEPQQHVSPRKQSLPDSQASPQDQAKGWRKFIPNVLRKQSLTPIEPASPPLEPPVPPPRPDSSLLPRQPVDNDVALYVEPNSKLDNSTDSILEAYERPPSATHTYVEVQGPSGDERAESPMSIYSSSS
jgi:hypothetical protein